MKGIKIFIRMMKIHYFILMGYFKGYLRYLDMDYKSEATLNKEDIAKIFSDITILIIERMGPTFVKFGQVLSSRPDLLPLYFIESLKKLQDDVAPFQYQDVRQIFLEDFNKEPDAIFSHFDKTPVASASVAQVHRAVLKTGEAVAVKIRRPNIKKNMVYDLSMLKGFAKLAEKLSKKARLINLINVIDELEKALIEQIDFNKEYENLKTFISNFKDEKDINFPKPYPEFSNERVLVMEFIDGIKPTNFKEIDADPERVADLGMDASLKMIYRDGFFHADPHPGNVFLVRETKNICIIDCGVVGRINKKEKEITLRFILGLIQNDSTQVAEAIFEACGGRAVYPKVDYEAYLKDIRTIFDTYVNHLKLSEMEFSMIISKVYAIVAKHKIKIVANYTMIFVALITIEGLAKSLVPDFDLIEKTRYYAFDIMSALEMV